GLQGRRSHQPVYAPHLVGGGSALHGAGHERAIPADLRLESVPRFFSASARLQIRGGHDVLRSSVRTGNGSKTNQSEGGWNVSTSERGDTAARGSSGVVTVRVSEGG